MSSLEEPLSGLSIETQRRKVAFNEIRAQHLDDLTRAIRNVLTTDIAEETFSQIVDGLPLASIERDRYFGPLCSHHPLPHEHVDFCPGVQDQFKELRNEFDIGSLSFDSEVPMQCLTCIYT